jgi:hypothetical protein
MRSVHRNLLTTLPLSVLLLAGCGKSGAPVAPGSSGVAAEQTSASQEVARHPELVEDGMYTSEMQAPAGSATAPAGSLAAIHPVFFWRHINRDERTFEFAFSDTDSTSGLPTTAVVTVRRQLLGTFNVVAEGTDPTDGTLIKKPLHDLWVRRLLLKRVDGDTFRPWRIAATSGVKVTSVPRDTMTHIVSLRVQAGALDTTITAPLDFFRLRRLLRFDAGEQVTLTATTKAANDVVVFYVGAHRIRFQSNGDDTYTLVWTTTATDGVQHFGVNALSHGTLFDDQAPYDSQAWILPYLAGTPPLADLAP